MALVGAYLMEILQWWPDGAATKVHWMEEQKTGMKTQPKLIKETRKLHVSSKMAATVI